MMEDRVGGRSARLRRRGAASRLLRLALPAGLCALAVAGPALGADGDGYAPAEVVAVVARLNGQRLSGSCRGSLVPAAAVIAAGVPAEGLKPAEVQEELEKQLAAIEKLVAEHQGTVRRLERLRAVRGAGEQAQKSPFVALQRLEIELPVTAPLDEILDRLLLLGVDRFGGDLRLDGFDGGAKLVALYRFDRLPERLREISDRCRQDAFRAWCEQRPNLPGAAAQAGCPALLALLKDYFRNEAFQLNGLRVVDAEGGVRIQTLSWPSSGTVWEAIRVGSPDPVELSGDFSTTFELRPR
jgi:hypothetical protein